MKQCMTYPPGGADKLGDDDNVADNDDDEGKSTEE